MRQGTGHQSYCCPRESCDLWQVGLLQLQTGFGKELSYEPSGKGEFLGLLRTKKGHNICFVYVRQDVLSQKGRNKQKNFRKEKKNIVSKEKVQNK